MIKLIGIEYSMGSIKSSASAIANSFNLKEKDVLRNGPLALYKFSSEEEPVSVTAEMVTKLLKRKGVPLSKIDGIFGVNNFTSETIMPSYTVAVAKELGLQNVIADQVGLGCGGIGQVFRAVFNQLRVDTLDGKISYYLVVTAEKIDRILDPKDRSGILFSDSAVACLITNDPDPSVKASFNILTVETRGIVENNVEVLEIKSPFIEGTNRFKMNGIEVFKFGSKLCRYILDIVGLKKLPIDTFLIPHQANVRMIKRIQKSSGLPEDSVYNKGIIHHGNTLNSSVLIALKDVSDSGEISKGSNVWLAPFGAELQVGLICLNTIDPTIV